MRYQRSRSSRHARKYHFFLAISSRNSVCFSATVYRAFFFFRNPENQLTKFDWLSKKRPLAVRFIVKIRLIFSKFHLPSPTCPNRPKTLYFSPIGYIWLSAIFVVCYRKYDSNLDAINSQNKIIWNYMQKVLAFFHILDIMNTGVILTS